MLRYSTGDEKINILEKTIGLISPKWAFERQSWRSGLDSLYDSGSRGREVYNWNPDESGTANLKNGERDKIRARAKDMERNSDVANAIISTFERNVVGTGMKLEVKASENDELNRSIEKQFKNFSKAANCDITGTQSLAEMEATVLRRMIVDGGIFILKVYTEDKKFPFKIQLKEVDELYSGIIEQQSNRVVGGVEINEYNKPVAYYFKKHDKTGLVSTEHTRVDAERVIFLFKKESPSQIREVSLLATALGRIKDLNQFIEAVSMKERVLACLSVFIKKATPASFSGGGRGVNTGSGKEVDYTGLKISPGMISELRPGDEIQTVVPSGQASNTKEFTMSLVRLIASGLGLSYEAVSRDLSNVNFSSARQGLLEDKKMYRQVQEMLIEKVLTPIYLHFLDSMYLTGQLPLKDYQSGKDEYLEHTWIAPGWQWIDPVREVTANKIALECGLDTLSRQCAERGEDWLDILTQRSKEIAKFKELISNETAQKGTEIGDGNKGE